MIKYLTLSARLLPRTPFVLRVSFSSAYEFLLDYSFNPNKFRDPVPTLTSLLRSEHSYHHLYGNDLLHQFIESALSELDVSELSHALHLCDLAILLQQCNLDHDLRTTLEQTINRNVRKYTPDDLTRLLVKFGELGWDTSRILATLATQPLNLSDDTLLQLLQMPQLRNNPLLIRALSNVSLEDSNNLLDLLVATKPLEQFGEFHAQVQALLEERLHTYDFEALLAVSQHQRVDAKLLIEKAVSLK